MQDSSPSGDRGPLERLCGDEAELERSLEQVRREAAAAVAAAREVAERIAADSRRALEAELARLRAEAETAAVAAGARLAEDATGEVEALARLAETNRPRAVARLVEIVLGRGPP